MRLLNETQLAALSTPRLLAYRDKLLSLEESAELSDCTPAEVEALDPEKVYFKDDPRWQSGYDKLKQILGEREHVAQKS